MSKESACSLSTQHRAQETSSKLTGRGKPEPRDLLLFHSRGNHSEAPPRTHMRASPACSRSSPACPTRSASCKMDSGSDSSIWLMTPRVSLRTC